jgi:hypothetical protein
MEVLTKKPLILEKSLENNELKIVTLFFKLENDRRGFVLNDEEKIIIGCKFYSKNESNHNMRFDSECLEQNHAVLYFQENQVVFLTHFIHFFFE